VRRASRGRAVNGTRAGSACVAAQRATGARRAAHARRRGVRGAPFPCPSAGQVVGTWHAVRGWISSPRRTPEPGRRPAGRDRRRSGPGSLVGRSPRAGLGRDAVPTRPGPPTTRRVSTRRHPGVSGASAVGRHTAAAAPSPGRAAATSRTTGWVCLPWSSSASPRPEVPAREQHWCLPGSSSASRHRTRPRRPESSQARADASLSRRWPRIWSTDTRTCSIESRSRTVTAPSSSESTSTVTQYGVPISSWRR